jgi:drug/metabolite transporter (DMT)-like permease
LDFGLEERRRFALQSKIRNSKSKMDALRKPRPIKAHTMSTIGGILALLIGVAGWYYLFYSQAASRLGSIESPASNQRRRRLRRVNGAVMLVLAVLLYAGFSTEQPQAFLLVWLGVCVLLAIVMVLGIADVWLTAKLPRR